MAKAGKKNVLSGRILEIEGLPDLKVEQAFELSDASAERSPPPAAPSLNKEPIIEYLQQHRADEEHDRRRLRGQAHLERRIKAMEAWLAKPGLLEADRDAEYAAVIEINLDELKEPVLACPNDPDDAKP